MAPSRMPKPTDETKDFFASVVPDHPAVKIRPMFGQLAVFVRLPEGDRETLLAAGGGQFEPMAGRPMREYVVLPAAWRDEPDRVREWAARSLDHADELPPKPKK